MYLKTTLLCTLFFAFCLTGCKKWDDHTKLTSQDLGKNLLEEIGQNANLSKFYEYLQKTGLDKELASSKTYTVFAPVNSALQSLDPAVVADNDKLKDFVGNHIALQSWFTADANQALRILMLNGKTVAFSGSSFDGAAITEKDKYMGNGVLHIISGVAPVYPNAWELLEDTRNEYAQSAYILSLTRMVFDPTNAIIDSINSQTGEPVYRAGTDSVLRNSFNTNVYNLEDESKQYTFLILNNTAFAADVATLQPYYQTVTGDTDSAARQASYGVVKDLIVEGYYTIDQLPAVLTSKFGVNISIDKTKIVETVKLSNGVAYIISKAGFAITEKIPPVIVQGENYRGFYDATGIAVTPRQNNVSAVFIRLRVNPNTGEQFNDMFVYGHGISALSAHYRVSNLPSVTYKVYWVAVNDTLTVNSTVNPVTFNQRLAMGDFATNYLPSTPAAGMAVTSNNYNEVYLGDYTQSAYGALDMYLTANASTGNGTNSLTLDYIKLVPDL